MSKSYCGNDCYSCEQFEAGRCQGCNTKTEKRKSVCDIAECCNKKEINECIDCIYADNCPKRDLRSAKARATKTDIGKSKLYANCFLAMFIAVITSITCNILSAIFNVMAITIFGYVCVIVYACAMLAMSKDIAQYRYAGIIELIFGLTSPVLSLFYDGNDTPSWVILVLLPVAALGIYGEYCEYMAHSKRIGKSNYVLSERWVKLWKAEMITFACLLGSICLFWAPILMGIVAIGGILAFVILYIVKYVSLFQSYKTFTS